MPFAQTSPTANTSVASTDLSRTLAEAVIMSDFEKGLSIQCLFSNLTEAEKNRVKEAEQMINSNAEEVQVNGLRTLLTVPLHAIDQCDILHRIIDFSSVAVNRELAVIFAHELSPAGLANDQKVYRLNFNNSQAVHLLSKLTKHEDEEVRALTVKAVGGAFSAFLSASLKVITLHGLENDPSERVREELKAAMDKIDLGAAEAGMAAWQHLAGYVHAS